MKFKFKGLLILLLALFCFGTVAGCTDSDEEEKKKAEELAAQALQDYEDAKLIVANGITSIVKLDVNKTAVANLIKKAVEDIKAAGTTADIDKVLTDLNNAIKELETADKAVFTAKLGEIAAITSTVKLEANKTELANLIKKANEDVNAAVEETAMATIVTNLKAAISTLEAKDATEVAAMEFSEYQAAQTKEVNDTEFNLNYEENKTTLKGLKETAVADIAKATTKEAVDAVVKAFEDAATALEDADTEKFLAEAKEKQEKDAAIKALQTIVDGVMLVQKVEKIANNFDLVKEIINGDDTYTITWKLSNETYAKLGQNRSGEPIVVITQPANGAGWGSFDLTATISATYKEETISASKVFECNVEELPEGLVDMTVAEVLAAKSNSKVMFDGEVTLVNGSAGFWVRDDSASVYVFGSFSDVLPGDKVSITGDIKIYYTLLEVINFSVSLVTPVEGEYSPVKYATVKTAEELKALFTEDKNELFGSFYTLSGVVISDANSNSTYTYGIKSYTSNDSITIYDSATTTAVKDVLKAMMGKYVTLTVQLYDFHTAGYARFVAIDTNIVETPVPELTPAEKVAAVKALCLGLAVDVTNDITLPTSFEDYTGVTVTWASDKPEVLANDGKVGTSANASEEVILTATITCGDVTDTAPVKVVVSFLQKSTVAAVNALIDTGSEKVVWLEGKIIGADKSGYFYLADETGVTYIYKKLSELEGIAVGDSVKVIGKTLLYTSSEEQYTREVTVSSVEKLDDAVTVLDPIKVDLTDLNKFTAGSTITAEEKALIQKAPWFGKLIEVTGFVKEVVSGTYKNYYLALTADATEYYALYHYSNSVDSVAAVTAKAGTQVTLVLPVFDYYASYGWRLGEYVTLTDGAGETDPTPTHTIAEAKAAAATTVVSVVGTVTYVYPGNGFYVADSTGGVYVYDKAKAVVGKVALGEVVCVTGVMATYNGPQIAAPTDGTLTVEVLKYKMFEYAPVTLTTEDLLALTGDDLTNFGKVVSIKGTVVVSGSYVNLKVTEDKTVNMYMDNDSKAIVKLLDGKEITLTAVLYNCKAGNPFNIFPVVDSIVASDPVATHTVADAKAAAAATVVSVLGTVTYVYPGNGFYVEDSTGGVYVYDKAKTFVNELIVGDVVYVTGVMGAYNGPQIAATADGTLTVEVLRHVDYKYNPTALTAEELIALTGEDLTNFGKVVSIEGTIVVNTSGYVNLQVAEGKIANMYLDSVGKEALKVLADKAVTLTAVLYSCRSGYVFNIFPVVDSVKEVQVVGTASKVGEVDALAVGAAVELEGQVVYVYSTGFMLKDSTGVIFVKSNETVELGDNVKLTGVVAVDKQNIVADLTKFEKVSNTAYTYAPQAISVADYIALDGSRANIGKELTVTGTLVASGNYINLKLDDSNTANLYITDEIKEQLAAYVGQVVTLNVVTFKRSGTYPLNAFPIMDTLVTEGTPSYLVVDASKAAYANRYQTISAAVTAATSGMEIKVLSGKYSEDVLIDKRVLLVGPNANILGSSDERVAEAEFTGTISIATGISGLQIKGMKFSGEAKISSILGTAAETNDARVYTTTDFIFENNYVNSTLTSGKGFIELNEANYNYSQNVSIIGNYFTSSSTAIKAVVYLDNNEGLTIKDNTFKSISKDAVAVYDTEKGFGLAGELNCVNNNFIDVVGSALWFNYYLPNEDGKYSIYVNHNVLQNVNGAAAIDFEASSTTSKYVLIQINNNSFNNCFKGVWLDKAQDVNQQVGMFNYNKFVMGSSFGYIFRIASSNTGKADCKYNLIINAEGNVLYGESIPANYFTGGINFGSDSFTTVSDYEKALNPASISFDFVTNFETQCADWTTSYTAHTLKLTVSNLAAQFDFTNANVQTSTITDQPVLASKNTVQYVTITADFSNYQIVEFVLTQWNTKVFADIHIEYTTDGTTWESCSDVITTPGTLSSNKDISAAKMIRLSFVGKTTSNTQVGLASVTLSQAVAE